jgi:hypothetical protein
MNHGDKTVKRIKSKGERGGVGIADRFYETAAGETHSFPFIFPFFLRALRIPRG